MPPSADARQLGVLLRIADTIDVVGDVTVTVSDPSQLLAWATVLGEPAVIAWRAQDSGQRFVNLVAYNRHTPVHGEVSVVLPANRHRDFWDELVPNDLRPGTEQALHHKQVVDAWNAMPITPPEPD